MTFFPLIQNKSRFFGRKRLWIHAGMHKTGTTYIQRMFVENQKELQEAKIWYPRQGRTVRNTTYPGHHHFAAAIRWMDKRPDITQSIRDTFASMPSNARHAVLSSENFSTMRPKFLHALVKNAGLREVRYVLYARAFSSHVVSCWQETVKHGNEMDFGTFLADFYEAGSDGDFPYTRFLCLNPALVAREAAEILGKDQILLVDFDRVLEQRRDLFLAFLERMPGARSGKIKLTQKGLNQRLPPSVTEALRFLNCANRDLPRPQRVRAALGGLKYLRKNPDCALVSAVSDVLERQGREVEIDTRHDKVRAIRDTLVDYGRGEVFPHYLEAREPVRYLETGILTSNERIRTAAASLSRHQGP